MVELPNWPNLEDFRDGYLDPPSECIAEYERARADAWEARARLMHEALKAIAFVDHAADTIAIIGELPDKR
jgi:hypothetical protein